MEAREGTPLLEWIAAALGLLITLALLGFIAWQAIQGSRAAPAVVTLEAGGVSRTPVGYIVDVIARNRTDATAAEVQIEGALGEGGSLEKSEATLSYVPGRSERKAALVFSRDPRRHGLSLRVTGYEEP